MIIVYAQNASDSPVQGNMAWAYIHKANSSWGNITLVVPTVLYTSENFVMENGVIGYKKFKN